jgi:hypothetical protein
VVPAKAETDGAALKEYLAAELPGYMVPAFFVQLDELPLTPSGKLDRRTLAGKDMEAFLQAEVEFVAPGTKTEKKIAGIWSKVLKIDAFSIHSNFFELGGHSLLIPGVFQRIDKAFPSKLKIADLYEYLTVFQLARYIDGGEQAGDDEDVIIELSID